MRRIVIFALILCTLLTALLCACSGKENKKPADTGNTDGINDLYFKINGNEYTSEEDPYRLTVTLGGSANLAFSTNAKTVSSSSDNNNASVSITDEIITVYAAAPGETRIKIYSSSADTALYILVTVNEPDISFSNESFKEGDGSAQFPYVVHVRLGSDLLIPFTLNNGADISIKDPGSDAPASFTKEGSVLKIHGNTIGHITNQINAGTDTTVYITTIVIEDSYAVFGRVIDKNDGSKAYSGVTVCLTASDGLKLFSKTDENGAFWFTSLDISRYSLTVSDDSGLTLSEGVTVSSADFTTAKEKLVIADIYVTENENGGSES